MFLEQRSAFNAAFFNVISTLQVVLTVRLMSYDFALPGMLPQEMHVQYVLIRSYLVEFLIAPVSADNHLMCHLLFLSVQPWLLCRASVLETKGGFRHR